MSFMGGAECSTSANPLSQLHKHTQNDRTLQQDRLVGRGPGGQLNGFRSQSANAPQDEMMNGFLNQGPSLQQEFPMQPGQMGPLGPAQSHMRANSASPTWAHDFNGQPAMESAFQAPPATQSHFNADEFARFQQLNTQGSSARASPMQSNVPSQMNQQRPMMGGMMNRPMGYTPMFQPMYQNQQPMHQPQQQDLKGKGRLVELDDHKWEEQFASMELQDSDKAKEQEEANAAEQELNEMDKGLTAETNEQDFDQFDTEWSNNMMPDFEGMGDWGRLGDPAVETYLFEQDNFFRDEKNAFEEGVRIMREGGNLSLAALAFESAVQQNPNHTEAWVYLGTAQAQNEKETAAIRALEQALKLDPNNLAALMGLAVSYTNEGYDSTAYRTLERWLSVKYPNILDPKDLHPPAEMGFTDRQQLHDKVTNLFIKAAQLSPDGEHMDPDVQVGLGVLFYGAEDYDKAVDCFQSALHSSEVGTSNQQEQLHLLWNRLGATLAVAQFQPFSYGYLNDETIILLHALGISQETLLSKQRDHFRFHHEAACHFLAALEMHKAIEKSGRSKAYEILGDNASGVDETLDRMSAQNRSSTLYDTLRRVFTQMGRRDLAEKTVAGVDPDVFRPEFEF
ncbi:hypothetical protein FOXG_00217 [Fusarium oxysporum f. sp. lycopersici 4287]|uniref:Uncharacterized protein n=1 Tax=Fusarium oxysporum f. sp. lycopersici (strain 4287 / CBS 123668 / FGSC 9935 / NRRL 34936) TaxID=426428 RepID=A0A0J9U478_FUSO4|nr:hypothetical protein FOXG_00217 [Fusarium oxysporum f. sp. lycopersici 4287]KNA93928.1 hypothetical protein FOXG_00217 [Fusarium oxysporum f. sp. lycopersici 4287]